MGTTKSWNLKLETRIRNLFIETINIIIIDGGPACARNSNEHERESTKVSPVSRSILSCRSRTSPRVAIDPSKTIWNYSFHVRLPE